MVIARCFFNTRRRVLAATAALLLGAIAFVGGTSGVAHASATTCAQESGTSMLCMQVNGSSTWVQSVNAIYDSNNAPICNYSAWFYVVPPSGGATGIAYQSHTGCTNWFGVNLGAAIYNYFPHRSLVCVKWYVNSGQEVGTKCVGLS